MFTKQNYAILSVEIAKKILGINNIEVVIKDNYYFNCPDISAVFMKESFSIVFNNTFIENASLPEIMITGFHEARHVYQYMQIQFGEVIYFKRLEEQTTLNGWIKDFEISKSFIEMTRKEYLNRPTEIDAIAFSSYLADKLLNVKQVVPEEIKDKVEARIEEIRNSIEI
ncbi:MAG TPA: hypothetical protein GX708_21390 [Gallicola sp.]|nr:hypothetical protein [Gallicola sp.]